MLLIDHIYKKQRTMDQLPKRGHRITRGQEQQFLGQYICPYPGGFELWRWRRGTSTSYTVFDPAHRRADITISGTRYPDNPDSLIIFGVYARAANRVRAVDLYDFLIRHQGLTIVSDRVQSPGGQRIWQALARRTSINVYGYNTSTNQAINAQPTDIGDLYVTNNQLKSAPVGMVQELKQQARQIRLVATLG